VHYVRALDSHGNFKKDKHGQDIVTKVSVHFKEGEKEHMWRHSGARDEAHLHTLLTRDVISKKDYVPGLKSFLEKEGNVLTYVDGPAFVPNEMPNTPAHRPDYNYVRLYGGKHHVQNFQFTPTLDQKRQATDTTTEHMRQNPEIAAKDWKQFENESYFYRHVSAWLEHAAEFVSDRPKHVESEFNNIDKRAELRNQYYDEQRRRLSMERKLPQNKITAPRTRDEWDVWHHLLNIRFR
jgi:hypothetical protein